MGKLWLESPFTQLLILDTQNRQRQECPCCGDARKQGEDRNWHDQGGPYEEQVRQDCEQEAECLGEEEVRNHRRPMDEGCQEGTRSAEAQGLRRNKEGLATLHQGQGVLQPVS